MFDRYTKVVLTVIAVALSGIAIEGGVTKAQAQAAGCGDISNPCYVVPGGLGSSPMAVYIVGGR